MIRVASSWSKFLTKPKPIQQIPQSIMMIGNQILAPTFFSIRLEGTSTAAYVLEMLVDYYLSVMKLDLQEETGQTKIVLEISHFESLDQTSDFGITDVCSVQETHEVENTHDW